MIKNIIIVCLIVIMLIVIYSWICVSNSMSNFQKTRMEYIINKENELHNKELKLISANKCNKLLLNYSSSMDKLLSDLNSVSSDLNNLAKNTLNTNSDVKTKIKSYVNNETTFKINDKPYQLHETSVETSNNEPSVEMQELNDKLNDKMNNNTYDEAEAETNIKLETEKFTNKSVNTKYKQNDINEMMKKHMKNYRA